MNGLFKLQIPNYDYTIFRNGVFDSSGNIIAVGGAQKFGWENPSNPGKVCNYEALIAKINSRGELVNSFKNLGYSIFPFTTQNTLGSTCTILEAVSVDISDNTYVATSISTGSSSYFGIYIAKLDQNGNLVKDFGNNGIAKILTSDNRYQIEIKKIILKDNKIYLAGRKLRATPVAIGIGSPNSSKNPPEYIYDSMVIRLNIDGSVDENFGLKGIYLNSSSAKNNSINDLIVDDSGIIYIGGVDTSPNGKSVASILSLDSIGKPIPSFGQNGTYIYKYNSNNFISRSSVFGSNGTFFGIGIAENCNNCETHIRKFKLN